MKVSAQYAQEHFPDLLAAADSGEPVEIARPDKPTVLLVPQSAARGSTPSGRPRRELLYAGEGLIANLPTDEEWRAMDKELEDEMLNGPIFPPERV